MPACAPAAGKVVGIEKHPELVQKVGAAGILLRLPLPAAVRSCPAAALPRWRSAGLPPLLRRVPCCMQTVLHAPCLQSIANVRKDHPELLEGGTVKVRWRLLPPVGAVSRRHGACAALPSACAPCPAPPPTCRPAAPHLQLRAGNVLGDALEGEEPFDAIHVGAGRRGGAGSAGA